MSGGKEWTDDAQVTEDSDALAKVRALLRILDTLPYDEHPLCDDVAARLRSVPGVSSSEADAAEAAGAQAQRLAAEAWEWAFTEAWVEVKREGWWRPLFVVRLMAKVAADGTAEQVAAVLRMRPQAATECGRGCWRCYTGWTVLHCAALWRWEGTPDSAAVRALMEHKAQVDARDRDGQTPLHCAAGWNEGKPDVVAALVRALVEYKAQVDARGKYGKTPLHCAAGRNKGESETVVAAVRALVEHKAQVDAREEYGETPLHCAAAWNKGEPETVAAVVRALVEHKAHVDARDEYGWTPLHCAAEWNKSKPETLASVVRALVEHKAQMDALSKDGRTPLHFASNRPHVGSVFVRTLLHNPVGSAARDGPARTCPPKLAALLRHEACASRPALHAALCRLRDEAVRLDGIKDAIATVVSLRMFGGGLKFGNFALQGATGTGKSHVARLVADVLLAARSLGARASIGQPGSAAPKFVHMHASDIVAGHVGQTAAKTRAFLDAHKGHVLFFDEANKLVGDAKHGASYGAEAVSAWLSWLEEHPGIDEEGRSRAADTAMCIVAGYPEDLQKHFFQDPGFAARFEVLPELPPLQPDTLWSVCLSKMRHWQKHLPLPAPETLNTIEGAVTLAARKGLFTADKVDGTAALFPNAHGCGEKLPERARKVHCQRLVHSGCQARDHRYAWCYADFYDALVAMAASGQAQRKDYSRIKMELERDLPSVQPGVDDVCGVGADTETQLDAGVRYEELQNTKQHEYLRSGMFDRTCQHCGEKNAEKCAEWGELLSSCCSRANCSRLAECVSRADTLLRAPHGDNALRQYAMYKLLPAADGMLGNEKLESVVGATLKTKLADAVVRLREIADRNAAVPPNDGGEFAVDVAAEIGTTAPGASGDVETAEASAASAYGAAVAVAHPDASHVSSQSLQSQQRVKELTAELEEAHKTAQNAVARAQVAEEGQKTAERDKEVALKEKEALQREKEEAQQAKEQAQREKESAERRTKTAQEEKQQAQREAQREKAAAERRIEIAQREKEEAQREKEAAESRNEIAQREKEEAQREKEAAERRSEIAQREKEKAQQEKEAAERRSEIAQREKEEAQREKEEAQLENEQAQREKEEAQRQKELAIQEKNAVQAVLAATRQRVQKVVAVARAVAAVAPSLLSFVWAIGLVTTLGLAFWPATAVVVAIVAVTALVR